MSEEKARVNKGRSDRADIESSSSQERGRIAHERRNQRPRVLSSAGSALLLAGVLTLGVTGWEHLFHAAHLGLAGSAGDHLAHVLRDGALAFPIGLVAVVATRLLARMPCLRGGGRGGDLLLRAALLSLVFGALLIPSVGLHGVADSFLDPDGGADANALGHDPLEADATFAGLALHGIRDALLGQLAAFPLALAGFKLEELAQARPRRGLLASPLRVRRLALAGAGALAAALLPASAAPLVATPAFAATDPCSLSTTPTRTYNVSAINVKIPYNRFGDNDPLGMMYVLDQNISAVRSEESSQQVSTGLREDPIQPLVIRGNLGECVTINFTNRTTQSLNASGQPTAAQALSLHVHGVSYQISSAGSSVGFNPNSFAGPGQTVTYTLFLDPALGEGAKVFHTHGDSREMVAHGLFGVLNAEPQGSTYLDPQTGQPLNTSNWEAIIQPATGTRFRESTIVYHEVGDETFQLSTSSGGKLPLNDPFTTTYRPGGRALNYRSEPFFDRMQVMNNAIGSFDKSQGYGSYMFGDPSTPIPRSYLGEPTKTRLVHAGSEQAHVHHLHGGGDRWRQSPGADNTNDISGGLEKYPVQQVKSIRLDSQTINPGEAYTLEHECGAGGCQQVAGDFLFHCHIAHHYLAGMWGLWRVFDTLQPDLATIPGRTAAPTAVTSDQLLGRTVPTVNGNRTIVLQSQLTDPTTQISLEALVENQLPPQGARIDSQDATTWDWVKSSTSSTGLPLYQGEPEDTRCWANFCSPTPGQRPNILFDPNNGRYAWPLLQPHLGQRPPFSPNRHTGAPWLGETAAGTRTDGLCPSSSTVRTYNITALSLSIQETAKGATDTNGMLFVLNEDKNAILGGQKPAIPLAIRSNTASPTDSTQKGDCVALTLTSQLNPTTEANTESKVNMHTHFVQFDPQASDGVITGRSFEQSVKPFSTESRTLAAAAAAGATQITVSSLNRLRVGIFIAVGQGEPTIELRKITAIDSVNQVLTLDQALANSHPSGEPVGVEFVQYRWFSDVDSGTVFWHDHVDGIHSWGHGLFGAHVIEPFGSTYHDPQTGAVVRSGQIVDIWNTTPGSCVGVVALNQCGSFREFMLWLHDNLRGTGAPVGQEFGSINLRANPFSDRGGDTDPFVFSSVKYGDPFTPMPRAYVGDQFVIRTIGLTERVGALRVTGHRFRFERFNSNAALFDAGTTGISERFDYVLDGGAGGPARKAGDYLYYSSRNFQLENGAWGVIRVHDTQQSDLEVLPGTTAPPTGAGFPQLSSTGNNPPAATSPGNPCPSTAPLRSFAITAFDVTLPLGGNADSGGTIYALSSDEQAILGGQKPVVPLVIRANAGDCVQVQFTNHSGKGGGSGRAGLSLGRLLFDPQGSYGVAIGLNPDSSVPRNGTTTYSFFADRELGTSIFLNFADVSTLLHGAYGALVVEPTGSTVYDPNTGGQLLSGPQAVIESPSGSGTTKFREFAALFHDTDPQIGRSVMPYNTQVQGFASLNYQAAPLDKRLGVNTDPSLVFNSSVQGDPATTLMRAYPGDPMRFRVAVPASENVHTFTLEGHSWPIEPFITGAQQLSNRLVMSGEALDAFVTGGAGGTLAVPGDYLYGDHRFPFTRAGMWGLFRVHATQQPDLPPLTSLGSRSALTAASSAPTGVTAQAGHGAAALNWTAPTGSTGQIRGYVVVPYLNGTTVAPNKATFTNGTTSELVLGLTNGTPVGFKVAPVTSQGVGTFSSLSNLVTPLSVASAPDNVAASDGAGSATVTWSAPTSDGASPISGYVVTVWTNNSLTLIKQVTFPASATSGTVTGLTAGTTYTFTVAAVNGVGAGPGWPVTNAVTAS